MCFTGVKSWMALAPASRTWLLVVLAVPGRPSVVSVVIFFVNEYEK